MEKFNKDQIWEGYLGYESKHLEKTLNSLEKEYDEQKKLEMAKSLCFWKYMRDMDFGYEEKIEIYKALKDSVNPNIAIISAVEALPTKVWRKLLWRENIDFMSFESFLRRLSPEQKDVIISTANGLHCEEKPKVPKFLTKRIFDFILVLLGIITAKKLVNAGYYYAVSKYLSKGAWAFNLLGIDFGFSLYPNGVGDDTKITNKKWTRFLSIKEHINDFIVNQEDGIYWWMYSGSRSFLIFRFKKEVELKSHVCPGFWATIIFQIYFWIVSPVVSFIFIYPHGFSNLENVSIAVMPFLYTPLYVVLWAAALTLFGLALALVFIAKKTIPGLSEWLDKIAKSKWFKALDRFLSRNLRRMVITALIFTAVYLVYVFYPYIKLGVVTYYTFMEKYLKSGIIQTTLLMIWLPIEITKLIKGNKSSTEFGAFRTLVLGMFLINLLDSYVMESFVKIVYSLIPSILNFFIDYAYIFGTVLLMVLPLLLVVYFSVTKSFEPEKYSKFDKFINWFAYLWIALMVAGGIYVFGFAVKQSLEYDFFAESKPLFIMLTFFALVAILSMQKRTKKINQKTIDNFLLCQNRVLNTYYLLRLHEGQIFKLEVDGNLYRKNKALIKMSEQAFELFLKTIGSLKDLFNIEKSFTFADTALLNVKEDGTFKNSFKSLNRSMFIGMEDYQKIYILCGMIEGRPFLKLKKEAEAMYVKKQESKAKVKKTLTKLEKFLLVLWRIIIFIPLKIWAFVVLIGRFLNYCGNRLLAFLKWVSYPFVWVGVRIGRLALTLKDLWDLFNNRCPEVSKSKDLEYDL